MKDKVEKDGAVIKQTTPDGRIVYDVGTLIRSTEVEKHFERLTRLVKKGLIPQPDSTSPRKP